MTISRAVSSAAIRTVKGGPGALSSRPSRNGATRSTPIASPVHQTAHVGQKSVAATVPDSTSTEVPKVALIAMPARAPSPMIATASRRRSSSSRNPVRLRSSTATSGASVLPAAMTAAPRGEGPIGRLTARAAAKIAGQIQRPKTRIATSAIPVGGQIGVTWPCTRARFKLRRAVSQ
jgi:hypothetical protein